MQPLAMRSWCRTRVGNRLLARNQAWPPGCRNSLGGIGRTRARVGHIQREVRLSHAAHAVYAIQHSNPKKAAGPCHRYRASETACPVLWRV